MISTIFISFLKLTLVMVILQNTKNTAMASNTFTNNATDSKYTERLIKIDNTTGLPKIDELTDEQVLNAFYNSTEYHDLEFLGRQPLHIATILGNLKIVQKLIKQGNDVNIINNFDYTPLLYAAENGHFEILKYLLNNNASIDHKNRDGSTALILAVQTGYKKIVEYLCLKKANVNIKDTNGKTALDYVRNHPYAKNLKIILEKYANQTINN